MFNFLKKLFSNNEMTDKSYREQIEEFERGMDCCILGYHKWYDVEDKYGNKPYRICDRCGLVMKKGFTGAYIEVIDKKEKEALFNCIKFVGNKYKLLCS